MSPLFHPPYVAEIAMTVSPADRTFSRLGNRLMRYFGPALRGRTVLRIGGVWQTVANPSQSILDTADLIIDTHGIRVPAVFLGGHVHPVSDAIAAELSAAGYTITP